MRKNYLHLHPKTTSSLHYISSTRAKQTTVKLHQQHKIKTNTEKRGEKDKNTWKSTTGITYKKKNHKKRGGKSWITRDLLPSSQFMWHSSNFESWTFNFDREFGHGMWAFSHEIFNFFPGKFKISRAWKKIQSYFHFFSLQITQKN